MQLRSDVSYGVGLGVALHALTWSALFVGIDPATSDTVLMAVRSLYPGLIQWVYLVPAIWLANLRRRPSISRGILIVGISTLAVNLGAAAWLILSSQ